MAESLEKDNQVLKVGISRSQQASKRLEDQLAETKLKLEKAKKELEMSDDELQRLAATEQEQQATCDTLRTKYEIGKNEILLRRPR